MGARLLSWEVILGSYCMWFPGAREARLWMPVSRGLQSFGIVLKCVTCMKTCVFRGFWHRVEPPSWSMPNNNKLGQTICNALGRAQSKSFLRLGRRLFWSQKTCAARVTPLIAWSMKFTVTLAASQIRSHAMNTSFRGPF